MDSNLTSCPTCGHSVINSAGACTYCGAMLIDAEVTQQENTEANEAVDDAQLAGSLATLPQDETPSDALLTDRIDDTSSAVAEQVQSDFSQKPTDSPAPAELSEEVSEWTAEADIEPISAEKALENQPHGTEPTIEQPTPDDDRGIEVSTTTVVESESDSDAEVETTAESAQEPPEPESETVPAADNQVTMADNEMPAGSTTEDIQLLPEQETADMADDSGDSEKPGEGIVELVEIQASQPVSETPSTPETSPPAEDIEEEAKTKAVEEMLPKGESDVTIDADAENFSKSSNDTIWLDISDEIQPSGGESADKIEETVAPESSSNALKIEQAAQDMAAAIKKQKASLAETQKKKNQEASAAKAQALKKQKAAIAKARAVKKQKAILAKSAEIKRKKAAQSKAQALKKQEAAQADIETAKTNAFAAAKTAAGAATHENVPSPEASSKVKDLLDNYKGQSIGINYDNSADIREAQLVETNGEYFSVFVGDKSLHYTYPLKTILTIIEGKDGVEAGDSHKISKFNAVIKVYPLVFF